LKDVPNLAPGEQDVSYAYDLGNWVNALTNPGWATLT
jgi:hypothetical protein